ncbi:GNAT family N-acetyltransferase [Georgenia muralis]|uniref:2-polyprenyl-6-methoxyphenol hydroxylase-like FAD-dependent oxidoreductase n=1 Tax=Georgenia muralis TaxID=154117 RepID=A0A3N4Z6B7_9MICO|nr:GNAT family N-acetyltransferase [Georgenia muralis]RPF27877.1 2-polyprenyl-6-methoxyphenol hydroxylase-like FAD-dependent oxidoreductase [Georgenia muralis]
MARTPSTVDLVPLPVAALAALADGDLAAARAASGLPLTEFFLTPRAVSLWRLRLGQIREDPEAAAWVARAAVLSPSGEVVGHAGFHGPPDAAGMVEIGYSIAPAYRRRGHARAAVRALLALAAADPRVRTVRASISPDNAASLATVAPLGFVRVGEQWDDEDGLEVVLERPVRPVGPADRPDRAGPADVGHGTGRAAGADRTGPEVDVLVVGAGPTGLALCAQLLAHGARVRLVDRGADRAHESRALAVQPRTMEVLAPLGITAALVAEGNPAVRLAVHLGRRTAVVPLSGTGLDTPYPFLLFLSQARTEQVLIDHLAGGGLAPEREVELTGLSAGARGVTCRLRGPDGEEQVVRAGYVVGCDGARSTVRDLAGIAFLGERYPQSFVLADVAADGPAPGAAHAYVGRDGMLLMFPIEQPAPWRIVAMRRAGAPHGAEVTLPEVQALVDAHTSGVRLHDPVWLSAFGLARRRASRLRAGRVLLAGDAAHVHSPAGAQGMNTGIQDAVNLGWKLALVATGRAAPDLLDTYEAERMPVARRVLRMTDRAFTVATSTAPAVRLARAHVAPRLLAVVLRARRVPALGFRVVAQLTISYRGSPLAGDPTRHHQRAWGGPSGRRLRAGDRLPVVPLVGGGPATLHGALARPAFHLLLAGRPVRPDGDHGPAPGDLGGLGGLVRRGDLRVLHVVGPGAQRPTLAEPDVLVVRDGADLERLGLARPDGALLVRPDGHLAHRGASAGARAWLARWLRP